MKTAKLPPSRRAAATGEIICQVPFGEYKQSGCGREMGSEALELYTETKAVCVQL